ncbi:hypothetical protein EVAR_97982_1 [Eumeta japonica]|uniref:Uncharacterized protein n=1 Tax=Eumeta variegata TaxID=151549 RepID=A0A4C1XFD8_EUMVA|nr:hypothetical protein EVAR_97982_1 [Eumeta japonica]
MHLNLHIAREHKDVVGGRPRACDTDRSRVMANNGTLILMARAALSARPSPARAHVGDADPSAGADQSSWADNDASRGEHGSPRPLTRGYVINLLSEVDRSRSKSGQGCIERRSAAADETRGGGAARPVPEAIVSNMRIV